MARQQVDIIKGNEIKSLIAEQILSRRLGRLAIPNTAHEWITLLLKIEKGDFLLIDGVLGFESAFPSSPQGEIFFEFLEKEGVLCQFRSPVIRFSRQEILVQLPNEIIRNQRRAFYRIEAPEGAEVLFTTHQGKEIKAKLRDYSMGGLSFYIEESLPLAVGDDLSKVTLRLPQGKEWVLIHIARAVVIRWEAASWGQKPLWAFEILEISEGMREKLRQNIFINQRDLIRRVKRIPTLKGLGTKRA